MTLYACLLALLLTSPLAATSAPLAYTLHPYKGTNLDPCQGQEHCHSPCPRERAPPSLRLLVGEVSFDRKDCLVQGGGEWVGGRGMEGGGKGRAQSEDCSPNPCLKEQNYVLESGEVAISMIIRSDANDGTRRQLLETRSLLIDILRWKNGTIILEIEHLGMRSSFTVTTVTSFTHILLQGNLTNERNETWWEVYVDGQRVVVSGQGPSARANPHLNKLHLGKARAPRVLPGESGPFVGVIKTVDLFYTQLNQSAIDAEVAYARLLVAGAVYPECLCPSGQSAGSSQGLVCGDGSARLTSGPATTAPPTSGPVISAPSIYPSVYGLSDGLTDPALPYGYWLAATNSYVILSLGAHFEITQIEVLAHAQAVEVFEGPSTGTLWYSLFCAERAAPLSSNCTTSVSWEAVPNAPYQRLAWQPALLPPVTDRLLLEVFDGPTEPLTAPYSGANPIYEVVIYGRLPNNQGPSECMCFPGNTLSPNDTCDPCGQCACRDGGDTVLAGKTCGPYVSSVTPLAGPLSGGTLLTLHGGFLSPLDTPLPPEVTLGQGHKCKVNQSMYDTNDTLIVCRTTSLQGSGDNSSQRLPVHLSVGPGGRVPLRAPLHFTYRPDPHIQHLAPMSTFLRGGIRITVSGESFHEDFHLKMHILETTNGIDHEHTNDQECSVHNSTTMICPTPAIRFDRRRRRAIGIQETAPPWRPRRELRRYLNTDRRRFTLVFDLAGLVDYQRYPAGDSPLFEVYEGPRVDEWKPLTRVYKTYEGQPSISIYGQRLRDGCSVADYTVTVGDEPCGDVQLPYDNRLTCHPPTRLQHLGTRPLNGAARIRVRVGNLDVVVGYLRYHHSVWDDEQYVQLVAGGAAGGALLVVVALLTFWGLRWRRRRQEAERAKQAEAEKKTTYSAYQGLQREGVEDGAQLLSLLPADLQAELKDSLIDVSRLTMLQSVGQGNFGKVFKGMLECENGNTSEVAVKTLHDGSVTMREVVEFLKEATIMRDFSHPNVLTMHGVVLDGGQAYVLLPYMANGDLKKYLTQRPADCGQYLGFCCDAARGMAYLADHKFVHRDLAARNCMVDSGGRVLVADFGLARDIYEKDYYRIEDLSRPMPYKWMALEALSGFTFTSKSDVWSFGVLMWEVFTRGRKPYADVENRRLRQHLTMGSRLEQPPTCPDAVYTVMQQCWHADPGVRPTFDGLVTLIEALIQVHPTQNRIMSEDYDDKPHSPDIPSGAPVPGQQDTQGLLRTAPSGRMQHQVRSVPNTYSAGPGLQEDNGGPEDGYLNLVDGYLNLVDGPHLQGEPATHTILGDSSDHRKADHTRDPSTDQRRPDHTRDSSSPGVVSDSCPNRPMDLEDYLQPVQPVQPALPKDDSQHLNQSGVEGSSVAGGVESVTDNVYLEVVDTGYLIPLPPTASPPLKGTPKSQVSNSVRL